MHLSIPLALVASAAALFTAPAAQAAVINLDFSEQSYGNCAYVGTSMTSQGVSFTKTGSTSGFYACNNPYLISGNGSTKAMIDANARSQFDMALAGGGAFDLLSFDAGARNDGWGAASGIRLTGLLAGGGTVTTDLVFGSAWSTYTLTGFSNLLKVSWLALGSSSQSQFVFDNVRLDNAPVAGVPEPASLALVLGAGIAAVGARRRVRAA